jgi:hypothetical protein
MDGGSNSRKAAKARGMFPTPYGLSANQGQGDGEFGKAIRRWPTPCKSDAMGGAAYTKPPGRQGAFLLKEVIRGALNADWVSILMGFPADWTDVEDGSVESQEQ